MIIARRVYYSGTVQGVGFRYTARQIAEGFEVSGFVRNLPDGRVEIWAEGAAVEVERFLQAVSRRMAENIDEQRILEEPSVGMKSFDICL
jgi:acylphosphatase